MFLALVLVSMVISTAAAAQLVTVDQRTIFKIKASTVDLAVNLLMETARLALLLLQTQLEFQVFPKLVKLAVQSSTRNVLPVFAVVEATSVVLDQISVEVPTGASLSGENAHRVRLTLLLRQMSVPRIGLTGLTSHQRGCQLDNHCGT